MEQLSIDVRYDLEHMEVTLSISDWKKFLKAHGNEKFNRELGK